MQARFDSELKDGRTRHEHSHSDLSSRYENLQKSQQDLLDKKREMESQIKELAQQLDRKEYEFNLTQNELKELRQGNQALDQKKYTQEKSLTEQMVLIQSLQREVKDKEQLIQKSQSLVVSLQEQSAQLADTNSVYKSQITKMEEKLEESKQEIMKGNTIISKQQSDYKQLK